MQAPSGLKTAPQLRDLLAEGVLDGDWVLDPRQSSIRLKSRSMWGLAAVNGVFREFSGNAAVCAGGKVSGTITVSAASIDTRNARRDMHLRSADFSAAPAIRTSPSPRTASGHLVRALP